MLGKLINKDSSITLSNEFIDSDFNINSKIKILSINSEFIKVEILNKKKKIVKLIDIGLIESIKIVEES